MSERPPPTAAIRAIVRGEVQGVGFRYATVRRARELGLTGWVRNAERGIVEVHAEGEQAGLDELVAFLHEGPPFARVADVDAGAVPSEGHEGFGVRA